MKDREFLMFLHERLEKVYGESRFADFMCKLRSIIETIPSEQETPNTSPYTSLDELRNALKLKSPVLKASETFLADYTDSSGRIFIYALNPTQLLVSFPLSDRFLWGLPRIDLWEKTPFGNQLYFDIKYELSDETLNRGK